MTRNGSTRAWRALRRAVLTRDRWRCQVPTSPGHVCGRYAPTAGHIIAHHHGGPDTLDNLRAECRRHNHGDGHAIATTPRRTWTWR